MQTISSIGYKVFIGKTVYKEINAFLRKGKYSKYFVFSDENSFDKCYSQLLANCKKLQTAEIIEIDSGD